MKMKSVILGWPSTILVAFVSGSVAFFPDHLGRIEGRWSPVVSDVAIEITSSEGGYSVIEGSFVKERQCDFDGIEWRIGTPGNSALLGFLFEEPSKLRLVGRQVFGPWRVQATSDQLQGSVFAEVSHRCHLGFRTITRFYP